MAVQHVQHATQQAVQTCHAAGNSTSGSGNKAVATACRNKQCNGQWQQAVQHSMQQTVLQHSAQQSVARVGATLSSNHCSSRWWQSAAIVSGTIVSEQQSVQVGGTVIAKVRRQLVCDMSRLWLSGGGWTYYLDSSAIGLAPWSAAYRRRPRPTHLGLQPIGDG